MYCLLTKSIIFAPYNYKYNYYEIKQLHLYSPIKHYFTLGSYGFIFM